MEHLHKLKNSIGQVITLTNDEFLLFLNSFKLINLKKGDYFLKEGMISKSIGFINSGVLVYYKLLDNGNEVTIDFAFEEEWVNNSYSRIKQTPSTLSIKAIEACELLVIQDSVLTEMYFKIPKLERLGRILMEQAYIKLVQQNIDLQVHNAKKRYENLLDKYPTIFQKVQLYHIANYLGIAPKSLSRIRKEMMK